MVPPDPADRLVHEPGKQVQCNLWFPHKPLFLGHGQEGMPPVSVLTSTFSGFFQALMLPLRTTPDLLGGMWSLLQAAGAVPPRATWDNATGIGKGKPTERTAAFAGTLGTEIKLLKARDPESKDMVERRNRFFRSSFMPGRHFGDRPRCELSNCESERNAEHKHCDDQWPSPDTKWRVALDASASPVTWCVIS